MDPWPTEEASRVGCVRHERQVPEDDMGRRCRSEAGPVMISGSDSCGSSRGGAASMEDCDINLESTLHLQVQVTTISSGWLRLASDLPAKGLGNVELCAG